AEAADQLVAEALAVQEAGASAIVLELVPAEVSARITAELTIPTIGIGAGRSCDGQVLVWQDMAGLSGFAGKFVKAYAQLGAELERAASAYHDEVRSEEHMSELQSRF